MSWLIVLMVLLFASFKNTSPKKQSVSVIIPAYNEEPTVGQVVKSLLLTTVQQIELLKRLKRLELLLSDT